MASTLDEASLHTVKGGMELEMRLPSVDDAVNYPPCVKFIGACMERAEEDPSWFREQIEWFDQVMVGREFQRMRVQLRIVK
jgi:hypothetical protein